MGRPVTDPVLRFWPKVEKTDGCWVWTAKTEKFGYGLFRDSPTSWALAHRFSYETHHGEIPEGLCVCHRCDNPSCVNPEHLFLGTYQDNSDDMHAKGRGTVGRRKMPKEGVGRARKLLATGRSQESIAAELGVSQGTISKIKRGVY